MSLQNTQNLVTDFCRDNTPSVILKQYDKDSRFIIVKCTENGVFKKLDNESMSCNIKVLTPDNRAIYKGSEVCTILDDGTVKVSIIESMVYASGVAKAELNVIDKSTNAQLSPMTFNMIIKPSPYSDDRVIASDEFSALTELIGKASKDYTYIVTEAKKSADAAKVSETNAKKSETNAKSSETNAASSASIAKTSETNAKASETNSAISENNAKTYMENAATSAITASSKADEAVASANSAFVSENTINIKVVEINQKVNDVESIKSDIQNIASDVSDMRDAVAEDKTTIEDTIKNSLLASSEEILATVKDYFDRAQQLYNSMYIDCDGETPQQRVVTIVSIDCGTPQSRLHDTNGILFDGGTPLNRQLAS